MTPTELWDIYYHAMKKWEPNATDQEIRKYVDMLIKVSTQISVIQEVDNENIS